MGIYVRCGKKEAIKDGQIEKPKKPDDARQLRGIFLIEPNDEEFKFTMKAACTKLEVPMQAGMPCKIPINHRNMEKHKTKYAFSVDGVRVGPKERRVVALRQE